MGERHEKIKITDPITVFCVVASLVVDFVLIPLFIACILVPPLIVIVVAIRALVLSYFLVKFTRRFPYVPHICLLLGSAIPVPAFGAIGAAVGILAQNKLVDFLLTQAAVLAVGAATAGAGAAIGEAAVVAGEAGAEGAALAAEAAVTATEVGAEGASVMAEAGSELAEEAAESTGKKFARKTGEKTRRHLGDENGNRDDSQRPGEEYAEEFSEDHSPYKPLDEMFTETPQVANDDESDDSIEVRDDGVIDLRTQTTGSGRSTESRRINPHSLGSTSAANDNQPHGDQRAA